MSVPPILTVDSNFLCTYPGSTNQYIGYLEPAYIAAAVYRIVHGIDSPHDVATKVSPLSEEQANFLARWAAKYAPVPIARFHVIGWTRADPFKAHKGYLRPLLSAPTAHSALYKLAEILRRTEGRMSDGRLQGVTHFIFQPELAQFPAIVCPGTASRPAIKGHVRHQHMTRVPLETLIEYSAESCTISREDYSQCLQPRDWGKAARTGRINVLARTLLSNILKAYAHYAGPVLHTSHLSDVQYQLRTVPETWAGYERLLGYYQGQ